MSFDHKPEDTPERDRIENAGGKVTPDGRVNGGLNLSRAIGDHAYKTNKNLPLQGKKRAYIWIFLLNDIELLGNLNYIELINFLDFRTNDLTSS